MFQRLYSKVILKDVGMKLDTANSFSFIPPPLRMTLGCKNQNVTQLKNLLILYVCIERKVESLLRSFKEWIDVFQSEWQISQINLSPYIHIGQITSTAKVTVNDFTSEPTLQPFQNYHKNLGRTVEQIFSGLLKAKAENAENILRNFPDLQNVLSRGAIKFSTSA